jgi:ABC-type proline/glycine betaine transport system permease subunit
MIFAHIMGIPVEESILPLVPVGTAVITALAIVCRTRLRRLSAWLRRRKPEQQTQ